MSRFVEEHPTLESVWRASVHFGDNTASYKFALAHALLDILDLYITGDARTDRNQEQWVNAVVRKSVPTAP